MVLIPNLVKFGISRSQPALSAIGSVGVPIPPPDRLSEVADVLKGKTLYLEHSRRHGCRSVQYPGRRLKRSVWDCQNAHRTDIPLPETVTGVIVEEARGAMTGVPTADVHAAKVAAKKPRTAFCFIVDRDCSRDYR
jgi:hypothetical protein